MASAGGATGDASARTAPLEGSVSLPALLGAFSRSSLAELDQASTALGRAIMSSDEERKRGLGLYLHGVRQRAARLVRVGGRARDERDPPAKSRCTRRRGACGTPAPALPPSRPRARAPAAPSPTCHACIANSELTLAHPPRVRCVAAQLAVARWVGTTTEVAGCAAVHERLHSQREALTHAADHLFYTHGGLEACRAPLYAVPDALTALASRGATAASHGASDDGNARKGSGGPMRAAPRGMLPACIEEHLLGPGATTSAAAFAARSRRAGSRRALLLRAERELRKLLRREMLPMRASVVEVRNGRVVVAVDDEFEMHLGVMLRPPAAASKVAGGVPADAAAVGANEEQRSAPEQLHTPTPREEGDRELCWRMLRVDLNAGSKAGAFAPTISAAHRALLLRSLDQVLQRATVGHAIAQAVDTLHGAALALVIDRVVFRQAQSLRDGPWKGQLRVERLTPSAEAGAPKHEQKGGGTLGDGVRVRYWLGSPDAASALTLTQAGEASESPAVVVYVTDGGDLAARLEPSPEELVGTDGDGMEVELASSASSLDISMAKMDLMALLSKAMRVHGSTCLQVLQSKLRGHPLVCGEESDLQTASQGPTDAELTTLSVRVCGEAFASVSLDIRTGRFTVRTPEDGASSQLLATAALDAEAALRAGKRPPAEIFLQLRFQGLRACLEAAATALGMGVVSGAGVAQVIAQSRAHGFGQDALVLSFVDAPCWHLVVGRTAPHAWPPRMALLRIATDTTSSVHRALVAPGVAQITELAAVEGLALSAKGGDAGGVPARLFSPGVARRVMKACAMQCRMLIKEAMLTEQLRAQDKKFMSAASFSGGCAVDGAAGGAQGEQTSQVGQGNVHFHFQVPSPSAGPAAPPSGKNVVVSANLDSSLKAGWEVTLADDYFGDLWREHRTAMGRHAAMSDDAHAAAGDGVVALTPTGLRFSYDRLHSTSLGDFLAQCKSVLRMRLLVLALHATSTGNDDAVPAGALEINACEVWPQRCAFTYKGVPGSPVYFEAVSKIDGISMRSSPKLPSDLDHVDLMLKRRQYDQVGAAIHCSVPFLLALMASDLEVDGAGPKSVSVSMSTDRARLIFSRQVVVDLRLLPGGAVKPEPLSSAAAAAASASGLRELPLGTVDQREYAQPEFASLVDAIGTAAQAAL